MAFVKIASKRGFTIVELLVVVMIIGVLIALLLPALNKARVAANITTCLSNVRQIGLAAIMYANDNTDYFPSTPSKYQSIPMYGYGGKINAVGYGPDIIPAEQRILYPYISNVNVFRCPNDYGAVVDGVPYEQPSTFEAAGTSYFFNCGVNTLGDYWYEGAGLWGRKRSQVARSSQKILFYERIMSAGGVYVMPWHIPRKDEHRFSAVFVCVDGHAVHSPEAVRSQDYVAGVSAYDW